MKLWLLRPITPNAGRWEPWYDKAFGFVIRAETESRARELAEAEHGDESTIAYGGKPAVTAWKDPGLTRCIPLTEDGEEEVVIRDFWSA